MKRTRQEEYQNFARAWMRAAERGLSSSMLAEQLGYEGGRKAGGMFRKRRRVEAALGIELPSLSKNEGFEPVIVETPAPLEELLERRRRAFEVKARNEDAARLIRRNVPVAGPYGILHFGDPHIDDDGTDIITLERHATLVRNTPALYGANVGDTTNNWVGRLARLYAEQSTTAEEAWRLAEWFIHLVGPKWLYLVGGNHDGWSGAGDPLKWITREANALYQPNEVRVELIPPRGQNVRVNARHDFSGSSMWNPTHGVMRAAQMGVRDHIFVAGHRHVSGYQPLKLPSDTGEPILVHCIQVASYKVIDRYAKEKGFRDQNISPAVLTVIDPEAPRPTGLVQVYHDIEEGIEWLKWKRQRSS